MLTMAEVVLNKDTEKAPTGIGNRILGIFLNVFLALFSLTCIFPLIWMFYSSLKEKRTFNADRRQNDTLISLHPKLKPPQLFKIDITDQYRIPIIAFERKCIMR